MDTLAHVISQLQLKSGMHDLINYATCVLLYGRNCFITWVTDVAKKRATLILKSLPQLTEQGDQSLHDVTAQWGSTC